MECAGLIGGQAEFSANAVGQIVNLYLIIPHSTVKLFDRQIVIPTRNAWLFVRRHVQLHQRVICLALGNGNLFQSLTLSGAVVDPGRVCSVGPGSRFVVALVRNVTRSWKR